MVRRIFEIGSKETFNTLIFIYRLLTRWKKSNMWYWEWIFRFRDSFISYGW